MIQIKFDLPTGEFVTWAMRDDIAIELVTHILQTVNKKDTDVTLPMANFKFRHIHSEKQWKEFA